MRRVEIDLNVRAHGNWTFTGTEDADGPVAVGDAVTVFEAESGLEGPGRIQMIDEQRRLLYLSVDWRALAPQSSTVAARLGAMVKLTTGSAVTIVTARGLPRIAAPAPPGIRFAS